MPDVCPNCDAVLSSTGICAVCDLPVNFKTNVTEPVTKQLRGETSLQGRYAIVRQLGRGGMGSVYEALDTRLGRYVAVKEAITPAAATPEEALEIITAFKQEATILASLHHSNLPMVYDHFEEEGRHYLVMELIKGATLEELLLQRQRKPFPVDQVIAWGDMICQALDYLHEHGVIFRDLKPDNIMVKDKGTLVLIDFGIARRFRVGKSRDTAAFGTVGYAPPEQYGQAQTDARSDIYSLGATLNCLLTGYDPTGASQPFIFPPAVTLNPEVPVALSRAIEKAVMLKPEDRWGTVEEFRNALLASSAAFDSSSSSNVPKSARSTGSLPLPASSSSQRQPGDRGFVKNVYKLGRSLAFGLIRAFLRPIVWLLPFPGVFRGLAVAFLLVTASLLVFNGAVRIPSLMPLWETLAYKANELVLLGSIAQVTGISILSVFHILLSIVLFPLGGLIGFLTSSGPRISPPTRYLANEECIGRSAILQECRRIWNQIAAKKAQEPTFVVLWGKPGVGKTTVIKRFFLDMEKDIQAALKLDRTRPRDVPYRYLLWIDCADEKPGVEQLMSKLPWPLRFYYWAEAPMDVFAESCARFLQNTHVAIFIDQLETTGPHETLRFWEPFLRSIAKRRPSRLAVWITAVGFGNPSFFRNLGQLTLEGIGIDRLKQSDVVKIVKAHTGMSQTAALHWVRAHWVSDNHDIRQLVRDAVSEQNTK